MILRYFGIYNEKWKQIRYYNTCLYYCSVEASVIDAEPVDSAVKTCQECMECLVCIPRKPFDRLCQINIRSAPFHRDSTCQTSSS